MTAGCLGVMIAMIGTDPQTGTLRWTFDSLYLWDGLPLTPLLLGVFALPELCDLLIARLAIAADTGTANIYKGQWQGVKDCFAHWWLIMRCSWIGGGIGSIPGISASVVDWLAYGHALKTEKGASADLRQGRRARRDRVGKLEQRQGGRRARSDRRLRRARQRHHGDPARRVPDSRPRARPGHADQESQHHLRDGVVGGAWPTFWARACATRSARNSPSSRRLRYTLILPAVLGIIYIGAFEATRQWGDLFTLAVLRPDRLDHEAVQVAAPAAHSRRGAGRHHRALSVHLDRALRRELDAAAGRGDPVRARHSSASCGRSFRTSAAKAA